MEPKELATSAFQFPDPRQKWIYEELQELVGPGPAAFFRDACWLMANPEALHSTAHLVAHLLREIESAFREVLKPVAEDASAVSEEDSRHKEQIKQILSAIGIGENTPAAEAWFDLAAKLHGFAHRRGLDIPRSPKAISDLWNRSQTLIDVLLQAIREHFLTWIQVLDRLLVQKQPTREDVKTLAQEIPNNAITRGYFFDRLENPEWLEPLWSKGFFKYPPLPVRDEEKGTIRFPPWPEARYLARMAKHKPDVVAEIIQQMEDTENAAVLQALIEAALAMPPEVSVTLVDKALKWAATPYLFPPLPEKLGALLAHWAQAGKAEEALRLASVLLDISLDANDTDTAYQLLSGPKPRDYEQILEEHYPELVRIAPFPALELLCDLLDKAIRLSLRPGENHEGEDFSATWRPAIEDHPQNRGDDVRKALVTGIRDTAEMIVRQGKVPLEEMVAFFEVKPWKVFRRIALHLLRVFHEQAKGLVAARLTDREFFEDVGVRHEYILLLRKGFSALSSEDQHTVLRWIEEGPDIEQFREEWQERHGKAPTEEDIAHYREIWQRDRLAWIGPENLPEDWRVQYRTLVQRYGEPEHPEFPIYITVGEFGPSSPKTTEELKVMSVEEIVTYLKTWQPPEGMFQGFSPEGLGRVLASVVAEEPGRFAEQAERFQGIDPTYVRALFEGLRQAIEQHKQAFNWDQVLRLSHWVVTQPKEIPGRKVPHFRKDPDWGWTRKAIAELLEAGFRENTAFPMAYRERAWAILLPLTEDPDPTPEDESRDKGTSMDPATLSLNTTRGAAMHAVLQYALWVRRYLEKQTDASERLVQGFEEMPEVRAVLEAHLNPANDPSLAIRAVYGQWFPWLTLLDERWARDHITRIFPLNEEERAYFEAAWNAYIVLNRPYDNAFDLLREQYGHAVRRIGHQRVEKFWHADPDKRLAEHLMVFYWRGKLPLDDPLLTTFWEQAPEALRGHVLEFVGRALKQTEGQIPEEILERLKHLWESRLEQARTSSSPSIFVEEMAAFGWWFVSAKFDTDWSLDQLIASLQIASQTDPAHMVLERLAETAQTHPLESVKCLKMIVEADTEGWELYAGQDHIREILQWALGAPDARQEAERVINHLGSRGFLNYGDLLKI